MPQSSFGKGMSFPFGRRPFLFGRRSKTHPTFNRLVEKIQINQTSGGRTSNCRNRGLSNRCNNSGVVPISPNSIQLKFTNASTNIFPTAPTHPPEFTKKEKFSFMNCGFQ